MFKSNKLLLTTALLTMFNVNNIAISAPINNNINAEFNKFINNFYQASNLNELKNLHIKYEEKYSSLSGENKKALEYKFTNMSREEKIKAINHFIKLTGAPIEPISSLNDITMFGYLDSVKNLNFTNINDLKQILNLIKPGKSFDIETFGLKKQKTDKDIAFNKTILEKIKKYITSEGPKQADPEIEKIMESAAHYLQTQSELGAENLSKKLDKWKVQGFDLTGISESAFDDATVNNNKEHHNVILLAASLQNIENFEKRKKAVESRFKAASQKVSNTQIYDAVHAIISNRVENTVFANNSGIAAGDNGVTFGPWVKGLYGIGSQKQVDPLNEGYSATNYGGSIGVDININDSIIGLAYSHIRSNIKFKQNRAGDKLDVASHVGSLYGQLVINDVFMWSPIISYNYSDYTVKDIISLGSSNKQVSAKGKYKGQGVSIDNSFSYKININDNAALIPNLGVRYDLQYDKNYTMSGAGIYNTKTSKYLQSSLVGSLGVKALMSQQISDNLLVQPALHASVEKYFKNKSKDLEVGLAWTDQFDVDVPGNTNKKAKIGYNFGASVLGKSGNIEVTAAYNCNLRKKYQSHQGSLKFKLAI